MYLLARMLNKCIVYDGFFPHGHPRTISALPHVVPFVLPNHLSFSSLQLDGNIKIVLIPCSILAVCAEHTNAKMKLCR